MSFDALRALRIEARCQSCQTRVEVKATRKSQPRVPSGWHRRPKDNALLCGNCWSRSYVLRAIAFPIASPVDASWPELRETLELCWMGSTSVSNWAVTHYRLQDVTRDSEMKHLPRLAPIYAYPRARDLYPDVDPSALAQLLRSTEARYRKARHSLIWQSASALPTYRYPVPYPIHNQAWTGRWGTAGEALIDVRLGGRRWTLRLRGGHEFRRQREAFGLIVAGDAVQGTLVLYRQAANRGDHRPATEDRVPGGGARRSYRVMAKLVAWLPRRAPIESRERAGILQLRTASDSFWIATFATREWRLHADHVRGWIAAHRRRLDRLGQDIHFDKPWPNARMHIEGVRRLAALKQHRRLESFCHEASAQAVRWAEREGAAAVHYDDRVRSFLPAFPWHQLRTQLATKLDEHGIALDTATDCPAEEEPAIPASSHIRSVR